MIHISIDGNMATDALFWVIFLCSTPEQQIYTGWKDKHLFPLIILRAGISEGSKFNEYLWGLWPFLYNDKLEKLCPLFWLCLSSNESQN